MALSRVLAATRVTQRIGRDLYDRNRPDLMAIYFEGTDEVGHVFAQFTPPRMDCPSVSEEDYREIQPGRRDVLRRDRPHPRPVDAPRGGGRRDAARPFRPRVQVGRRSPLRPGVGQLEHGGFLAPQGGRPGGLGQGRRAVAGARARRASSTSRRRCWRCSVCRPTAGCRALPLKTAFSSAARAGGEPGRARSVAVRRVAAAPLSRRGGRASTSKKLLALGLPLARARQRRWRRPAATGRE